MKYLHIINYDQKFTKQIFDSLEKYHDDKDNFYIILGHYVNDFNIEKKKIKIISKNSQILKLLYYITQAEFVIFNNMGGINKTLLALYSIFFKKKVCWIIWGGDMYNRRDHMPKFFHTVDNYVLKNLDYIAVQINQDYKVTIERYPFIKAKQLDFWFPFPYDVTKTDNSIDGNSGDIIKIIVGNSGAEENNHLLALKYLKKYSKENIEIVTPLSYGATKEYSELVISKYKEVFGEKYTPITEMMSFDKYLKYLQSMDIGIFAHNRQQAGHNIMLMLYFGKKVYINRLNGYYHASNEDFGSRSFPLDLLSIESYEDFKKFEDANQNIKNMNFVLSQKYLEQRLGNFFNGLK